MTERPDTKEMPAPAVEHEQATEHIPEKPSTETVPCQPGECGTGSSFPPSNPNGPQNA